MRLYALALAAALVGCTSLHGSQQPKDDVGAEPGKGKEASGADADATELAMDGAEITKTKGATVSTDKKADDSDGDAKKSEKKHSGKSKDKAAADAKQMAADDIADQAMADAAIEPGPATADPDAARENASHDAIISDDELRRFNLGPLTDEDIRQAVYSGLEAKLSVQEDRGDGTEAATELGDIETFKFRIARLVRGGEDISSNPAEAPDAMSVDVTGWYKKHVTGNGTETKPTCKSFDAVVPLVRQGNEWSMPPDSHPNFSREDHEDCY